MSNQHLTEDELRNRLLSGEHQFVERKPAAQKDVIQRVVVSFANSVKSPREGVLFIGVDDKTGKSTGKLKEDLGKAQQDVRGYLDQCYPPIPYYMTLVNADGQQVIAVVVTESSQTPHFTGKAYVRIGDSTIEASEEKIQELVEERLSKVRELRKWIGKQVTIFREGMGTANKMGPFDEEHGKITEVTGHWLTWLVTGYDQHRSVPLDLIRISKDDKKHTLLLMVPKVQEPN